MTNPIDLPGCTAEPLMNYLKALGVFRLVAEQADKEAQLSWKGGLAQLHSKLERHELAEFFLKKYRPTPVATPWNSASGFAPTKAENKAPKDKAARAAVEAIAQSNISQLDLYRETISAIRQLPRGEEDEKTWKQNYFARCRSVLPDSVIAWLDTCFALTTELLSSFPLLGSGGNDGVTDFGSLFMQRLVDVLLAAKTEQGRTTSQDYLRDSLFSDREEDGRSSTARPPSLMPDTVGQFHPGGIGGANATQGDFAAKSQVNPWDFVLMIEGAMLFAGSVTRRLGTSNTGGYSAFPFCVEGVVVGNGSFSEKEARDRGKEPPNSGELWVPLWNKPITCPELKYLFAEGRAQFGRRQARNSVEFGLAVNLLGVSRGIDAFSRLGFLRRNGKAFLATPLGRVQVRERPTARMLNDPQLLGWLDRLRDGCRETDGKRDNVPARYKTALRQIDRAMFGFSVRSETGDTADRVALVDVLRALGRAEQTLSRGLSFCVEKNGRTLVPPLQGLTSQWLDQADDGSPEFRLARALAGIRGKGKVGPFRVFLEPVAQAGAYFNWPKDKNKCAVWSKRPLAANLANVFRRRMMEAFRDTQAGVPLYSPRPARLADVIAFLREEIDEARIADLLWGLSAVDWSAVNFRLPDADNDPVPFEFGVPRLLVEPRTITATPGWWKLTVGDELNAKPDPDVFHILASGQTDAVSQCVDRASRRLKSGGLLVHGYRNRRLAGRPLGVVSTTPAESLLAAMLFPLANRDLARVANTVLYPPEKEE